MDRNLKLTKFIVKLNKLTKEDVVKWQPEILFEPYEGELVGKSYRTSYKDKRIRIFKYRKRNNILSSAKWTIGHKLQFTNFLNDPEWDFPEENAIDDLYRSVIYKAENIEGFLDKFLDEENNDDNSK